MTNKYTYFYNNLNEKIEVTIFRYPIWETRINYEYTSVPEPVIIKWNGDNETYINGSESFIKLAIKNKADEDNYREILIEGEWYVRIDKDTTPIWYGKIQTDFFEEDYKQYPYSISLNASDQLGEFSNYQFLMTDFTGITKSDSYTYTLLDVFKLALTDNSVIPDVPIIDLRVTPLYLNISSRLLTESGENIDKMYINPLIFQESDDNVFKNKKDCLEMIMKSFDFKLFQYDGIWWLVTKDFQYNMDFPYIQVNLDTNEISETQIYTSKLITPWDKTQVQNRTLYNNSVISYEKPYHFLRLTKKYIKNENILWNFHNKKGVFYKELEFDENDKLLYFDTIWAGYGLDEKPFKVEGWLETPFDGKTQGNYKYKKVFNEYTGITNMDCYDKTKLKFNVVNHYWNENTGLTQSMDLKFCYLFSYYRSDYILRDSTSVNPDRPCFFFYSTIEKNGKNTGWCSYFYEDKTSPYWWPSLTYYSLGFSDNEKEIEIPLFGSDQVIYMNQNPNDAYRMPNGYDTIVCNNTNQGEGRYLFGINKPNTETEQFGSAIVSELSLSLENTYYEDVINFQIIVDYILNYLPGITKFKSETLEFGLEEHRRETHGNEHFIHYSTIRKSDGTPINYFQKSGVTYSGSTLNTISDWIIHKYETENDNLKLYLNTTLKSRNFTIFDIIKDYNSRYYTFISGDYNLKNNEYNLILQENKYLNVLRIFETFISKINQNYYNIDLYLEDLFVNVYENYFYLDEDKNLILDKDYLNNNLYHLNENGYLIYEDT